jgi:hypothetical protein
MDSVSGIGGDLLVWLGRRSLANPCGSGTRVLRNVICGRTDDFSFPADKDWGMDPAMSSAAASLALLIMLSAGMFKRQLSWKPRPPRKRRRLRGQPR